VEMLRSNQLKARIPRYSSICELMDCAKHDKKSSHKLLGQFPLMFDLR